MPVIDKDFLVETALNGVDLTDLEGDPLPGGLFTHAIAYAQKHVERRLDVQLADSEYPTQSDRFTGTYHGPALFNLTKAPLQEVVSVKARLGGLTILQFPVEWVDVLDYAAAQVQILPVQGQAIVSQSLMSYYLLLKMGYIQHDVFGWWEFTYKHGFNAAEVDPDIKELIALFAANKVLQQAADIINGQAGVSSESFSMDGLSRSYSTTASAMYSAYSAQINENKERIKDLLAILEPNLRGIYFEGV